MEKIAEKTPDISDAQSIDRKLDEKVMELHSLFEISQTLNSSLNVTAILDNLLLTPMGKMMISKGIVLLNHSKNIFKVETLKGLSQKLIGQTVEINDPVTGPTLIKDIGSEKDECASFFNKNEIELILPIRSSNKVLGIIGFGKKILSTPYKQSELNFLNSLSNIAATAIENGLMVMQLQKVNRKLDKKVQELNTLFDIGKELNSTLDPEKILNLLSYAIMGEMMVNRCMVFVKDVDEMKLAISKGHKNISALEPFKQTGFLEALCDIKETVHFNNDNANDPVQTMLAQTKCPVAIPMRIKDETKGIIVIGEKILKANFEEDELEFLYTLGNEAIICLENARLFEETLEKQRMEEELDFAREIQQGLLPKENPELQNYEIAGMNIPSRQVGGDYYDCIRLNEDEICIAIADVSGKGMPASLLMANIQASLLAILESKKDLSEITGKINNIIHRNTGYDKFITFFGGILNLAENTFTSVNAGHNPPYFFHKDGTFDLLEKGGLLLGMMPNMPYEQETIQLQHGDWIIMFTDGISEAMNDKDEEFEEHRIEEFVSANLTLSAEEMKQKLYSEVKNFTRGVPQSDDITMIVVKVLI